MINIAKILQFLKPLEYWIPFLILLLVDASINLGKQKRARQFLMPVIAVIYCLITVIFLSRMNTSVRTMVSETIPAWLKQTQASSGNSQLLTTAQNWLQNAAQNSELPITICCLVNTGILLVFLVMKRIAVSILSMIFRREAVEDMMENAVSSFYYLDADQGSWFIYRNVTQFSTYLCTMFVAAIVISMIAVLTSIQLYRQGTLNSLFYPVFGIICIGELYFFVNGQRDKKKEDSLSGETDEAAEKVNYAPLREVLRRLFGDKLNTDNTTVNNQTLKSKTNEEVLRTLEESKQPKFEAYGIFMRRKSQAGMRLDHNYLLSGMQLLQGKSVLFNNPFYYDFIPYIFYPMNHQLLEHHKILIVLGRHGEEKTIQEWCREGMVQVTNVPTMWSVGVLNETLQENLDIGIVSRSSVHDLKVQKANSSFLKQVGFIMLIEPSRLIATAQIGLNSLIRHCKEGNGEITFCSCDKNCDGLLDALSHILMTSIEEVAATNRHTGSSSYMCWDADGQQLQHRMLPNISRYLGFGTELSFAALKNQVSDTMWYGGEAFPVSDIHWIDRQYYFDLLNYATLPAEQESMDTLFRVSPGMWNAKVQKKQYLTVEDESFNMFEVRRDFSTRATDQGFINVLSTEYLLKDYMADNNTIFDADPKAIPYIVADYAHTSRNVILRLCLRLCSGTVTEAELQRELLLIDSDMENPRESFWHELCTCYSPIGQTYIDDKGVEWLQRAYGSKQYAFSSEIMLTKRRFSMEKDCMETLYYIKDRLFGNVILGDLQNAAYISENESDSQYLGSELRGHIFQKYLPGQFFTLNGKYYEMLRVTASGQVMLRRAADHITGRPAYRQIRNYKISAKRNSELMGDNVEIAGMSVLTQYADIQVQTDAYWLLPQYNNFAEGRIVSVNGIPERRYCNKQILQICFSEKLGVTPEVVHTIAVLMNEVFRTLFAENQAYIVAAEPGTVKLPATYSLQTDDGCQLEQNCIYILEDSQLDMGLLVAVRRNLNRIFEIICDYLDWNQETIEASEKDVPEKTATPDYSVPQTDLEGQTTTEKKKKGTFWKRFRRKSKNDNGAAEVPHIEAEQETASPETRTPVESSEEDKEGTSIVTDENSQQNKTVDGPSQNADEQEVC